jgi:pimeloyl-ACP methyl ester carboxylesterase
VNHDTADNAIHPFRIEIPPAALDDLHRRLTETRWPDLTEDDPRDWGRGVPADYLRELAEYWRTSFDWRAEEAKLNAFDQFVTDIDGQPIHFVHVRSPEPDALPLLLCHGYPSSIVEYASLIGPLTDPRSHGGNSADAFHVVAPSLPGFGFSTPLRGAGWELARTTAAFAELMERLGYDRYGAHGGDIGAGITGRLGAIRPDHVVGTHVLSDRGSLGLAGEYFPIPDDLTDDERARVAQARQAWVAERGYLDLQSHRPSTIGYALTDSPVGQLAWITEKFHTWTNPAARTPDEAVDRDQLLTNISIYWFTRSGASAARFLYEGAHADVDWIAPAGVPAGWAVFNADPLLRRVTDPDHQIEHWTEYSEGGHFAAMEAPDLVVDDVRHFFRRLRA